VPVKYEAREIKGINRYLETLAMVFGDQYLDSVISDVLGEVSQEARVEMEAKLRATSENWTGGAASTLYVSPVQREGNYIFVEIGSNTGDDPAAFFKEFGSTRQAAEPWLRPTMRSTWLKNKFRDRIRLIFRKMGYDFKKLSQL
jgi:hypothetical protein